MFIFGIITKILFLLPSILLWGIIAYWVFLFLISAIVVLLTCRSKDKFDRFFNSRFFFWMVNPLSKIMIRLRQFVHWFFLKCDPNTDMPPTTYPTITITKKKKHRKA